jgi:hypothetical protein
MITNKGNQIIAKYMLGQAPEYAAYLAVGVGAKPLLVAANDTTLPTKKSMDFEAFRVPVLSRGIVNDTVAIDVGIYSVSGPWISIETNSLHGINVGDEASISFADPSMAAYSGTFIATSAFGSTVNYANTLSLPDIYWNAAGPDIASLTYVRDRLVFKAQLPPDQRYEMTEVAIYPAASNQLAIGYDSKPIAGFLTTEGWNRYDGANQPIDYTTQSLADQYGDVSASVINAAVFANSNNQIFSYADRKNRYETPRYLNRCLIVRGDLTTFADDGLNSPSSTYVTTSELALNMSKNSPNDIVKLAFSVVNAAEAGASPDRVRIMLEFTDTVSGIVAWAGTVVYSGQLGDSQYQVLEFPIKDFNIGSPSFSWARVNKISVYVQTLDAFDAYDGSYVVLDGIRLDNIETANPLYGMVAYSKLKNSLEDGLPLEKIENSQGYMEYRMGVSIY